MSSVAHDAAVPGGSPGRPAPGRLAGLGFRTLSLAAALTVLVLVVLPLLALLVQAVLPGLFGAPPSLHLSWEGISSAASDPYMLAAGVNSLVLAAATAALATLLGVWVAYLLVLTDLPGRRVIWGVVWLILISPSFLIAQGWELLLAPGGLTHQILGGLLTQALLSPVGVTIVLGLKLFPYAAIAVASGIEGLGQDVVHAARLAGAPMRSVWRRILLPLVLPAAAAGALIVFAEVLSDFGVASTLAQTANFPLTTYAIYSALEQFPVNFPEAAAASLMLVAGVGLAQWAQSLTTGRRSYATRWGGNRTLSPVALGRTRWLHLIGVALLACVAFGVPAATTAAASFMPEAAGGLVGGSPPTWTNYQLALHIPYGAGSFAASLGYALVAASLGLGLGLLVAMAWRRGGSWFTGLLQGFLTAAIAVPGIVLGAGYIFLWDQPWLKDVGLLLYGTPAVLVLGYIAGGMPYAVRVISGGVAQIPANALTAARSSGAGLATVVRRIVLPMLGSTWTRVWLMLFAGVVFELPVSQLLYPPGGPTLAVAIVHQFHNTDFGVGAALTVLSTGTVGILALAFAWLQRRLGRLRPVGAEADIAAEAGRRVVETMEGVRA